MDIKSKRKINLLLFVLFLSSAFALNVVPAEQEVSVFVGTAQNAFVNITNNQNESVYHVTLSSDNPDISFIDNRFNLTLNETKMVKMVIDPKVSYTNGSIINVISYKKTGVKNEPETQRVDISNIGYAPQQVEIFAGAEVIWKNIDTIKHSITSTLWDYDLNPNDEKASTFSVVGIYEYWDKYGFYTGRIIVKDIFSEEYVHNPLFDTSFKIKIKSKLIDTSLAIVPIEIANFTIEANKQEEAVLAIDNLGAKTANNVNFWAEPNWISFGDKNIILEAGKRRYLPYTITPLIINPEDTNKNYTITIFAQADNTLIANTTISIYVPYKPTVSLNETTSILFNQSLNDDFLLALFNTICQARPDYKYCNPKVVEKIVYKSAPIPYNHTQEDVEIINRRQLEIIAQMERFFKDTQAEINKIKEDSASSSLSSSETKVSITELLKEVNEMGESSKTQTIVVFVFLILIIIGFGLFFGGKRLYEYMQEDMGLKT